MAVKVRHPGVAKHIWQVALACCGCGVLLTVLVALHACCPYADVARADVACTGGAGLPVTAPASWAHLPHPLPQGEAGICHFGRHRCLSLGGWNRAAGVCCMPRWLASPKSPTRSPPPTWRPAPRTHAHTLVQGVQLQESALTDRPQNHHLSTSLHHLHLPHHVHLSTSTLSIPTHTCCPPFVPCRACS